MQSNFDLQINKKSLCGLDSWKVDSNRIERYDKKFFSVIGVKVRIDNREVISWDQPMIKPNESGVTIFIVTKFKGIYHFLIQQ